MRAEFIISSECFVYYKIDLLDNITFSVESRAFREWKFQELHRSMEETNDLSMTR